MADKLAGKAHVVRLDITSEVGKQAAHRYGGVRSVPTLILINSGAPVYRQTGIVNPGKVVDQVDQLLE